VWWRCSDCSRHNRSFVIIVYLQTQVNELSKALSASQQAQRETQGQLDEATRRLSFNSPLADPGKLTYLRQVLYEYMMGVEDKVGER